MLKRGRQSFTFEYKLKVVARADNFVSSRISFVFGCGLSASAGNLLKFFSCYCKKWPMRVIYRAGNRPEITVTMNQILIERLTTIDRKNMKISAVSDYYERMERS